MVFDKHLREELKRREVYRYHSEFSCGVGMDLERDYDKATRDKNFIISWILCGEGEYTEDGMVYPLRDGCVCMRRPGREYLMRLRVRGGVRLFLNIPQDTYPTFVRMLPELEGLPPVWDCPFERTKVEGFFKLYDEFDQVSSLELHRLFPEVVQYLLDMTGIQKNREKNPLLLGKRMLEENRSLSVEEIAARCGMKYNTFRKQITEELGMSPGQYRIRKRIAAACRLLSDGVSVGGTAVRLGYADVYSFTHQFTSVMGVSPSGFREKIGDKE